VVGFTNIEESGQEGIELAFQRELQGHDGSRGWSRTAWAAWSRTSGEPADAGQRPRHRLSVDSKVQFFAYQRVRDAVAEHKAKAGSVVVLDVHTGEVLALANYPSYDPGAARKLSGAQLRNRALTDIFEPGSTMKPFIAALALETGASRRDADPDRAGQHQVSGARSATRTRTACSACRGDPEVEQRRHRAMAMQMPAREMWELYTRSAWPEAADRLSGRGHRPAAPLQDLAPDRAGDHELRLRPVGVAVPAGARLHRVARDGEVMPVTDAAAGQPAPGTRVLSPETARAVRDMLQLAAGPGRHRAAGADHRLLGRRQDRHRAQAGRQGLRQQQVPLAWFVGLAPIDKPRIVVAVMVDEPSNGVYYGGAVAAPVFSQVVQQTLRMLGVPPDLEVKPQIMATVVPAEPESF
jgi:cell division protein FtsI (penicillin-binding protein 3)